jgi:hypothetical protein
MSKLFLGVGVLACDSFSMARSRHVATLGSQPLPPRMRAMAECCVADPVAQRADGAVMAAQYAVRNRCGIV